jgi:hypothetical protein
MIRDEIMGFLFYDYGFFLGYKEGGAKMEPYTIIIMNPTL